MSYTAKSIIIEYADNWGDGTYAQFRSLDLYLSGSLISLAETTDFTAYGLFYSATLEPGNIFDTSLSKIGTPTDKGWVSTSGGNVTRRVICVLATPQTFDSIVVNNGHNAGTSTTRGIKNTKIIISTDAITDLTYQAAVANSTVIFNGQIAQHVASNVVDNQTLTLIPPWDGTIPTPEIIISLGGESDVQIQIVALEIGLIADASSDVFAGVAIETPEISITGAVESDVQIQIATTEIGLAGSAESAMQIQIETPEINLTSEISSGVYDGIIISTPEIALTGSGSSAVFVSIGSPEILLTASAESTVLLLLPTPEIFLTSGGSCAGIYEFQTGDAIIRYFLTITGAEDGTTDIDIPLESFQARRRSGNPTYLQVVVPSVDFIDYLTDRPNGTMRISQGYELNGEVLQREIIIETDIESANTYQGGQNNSIVLIGYTTSTFSGKAITLDQATYRSSVNGKIHYRLAEPNIFLNPGDSVTIGTDTFTVGVMSYAISATLQQIEIEEA